MSKFEEYRDKYQYIKMERSDGILQMTFHSKGKELLWGGRPHEEASYAFYEVARDRENKAVIITATGDSFCADIIWGPCCGKYTSGHQSAAAGIRPYPVGRLLPDHESLEYRSSDHRRG